MGNVYCWIAVLAVLILLLEFIKLWIGRENETLPEGYTYELAFYDGDNNILQEITG